MKNNEKEFYKYIENSEEFKNSMVKEEKIKDKVILRKLRRISKSIVLIGGIIGFYYVLINYDIIGALSIIYFGIFLYGSVVIKTIIESLIEILETK